MKHLVLFYKLWCNHNVMKVSTFFFLIFLVSASVATAVVTPYTDEFDWTAAVAALPSNTVVLEDFENLSVNQNEPFSHSENIQLGEISVFLGAGNHNAEIRSAASVNNPTSTIYLYAIISNNSITINFPQAVTAFAAEWGSPTTGSGASELFIDIAGETLDFENFLPSLTNVSGFVGFISDAAFTSIVLHSSNEEFGVDNVQFNVPEPSASLFFALGTLGLALRRRR
jgi:hypothetical protein